MTANPLVAGPVDTSSALGGTMLVESLYDLSRAIESEDWVAAGLAGLSTVLDTAAAVMDPLGQLIAAGLGWLMEHVEPLKGWLNDLTGDAGAVLGFAGTWDNIATQMGSAAGDLDHLVAADLEGMRGQGIEAYARYASDFAEHLRGIGGSSTAVANSLRTCSTIVQVVHDLVRDAIAELVGAAISWAAQIVFTVGLGTPWVISQVATRVSSLAARVGSKVTGVITSAKALGDLIDALKAAIRSLGDNLRGARPGSTHLPTRASTDAPSLWDRIFGDALPADMNRFPGGEQIRQFFENIPAKPGFYDVGLHGSPRSVFLERPDGSVLEIDHRVLAELIRRQPDYDGGPIRLLSCGTGGLDDGFAQRLADNLGSRVEAPSDTLWIWPDGRTGIGPSQFNLNGQWRTFDPRSEAP